MFIGHFGVGLGTKAFGTNSFTRNFVLGRSISRFTLAYTSPDRSGKCQDRAGYYKGDSSLFLELSHFTQLAHGMVMGVTLRCSVLVGREETGRCACARSLCCESLDARSRGPQTRFATVPGKIAPIRIRLVEFVHWYLTVGRVDFRCWRHVVSSC